MSIIKTGGQFPMEAILEDAQGDLEITSPDGVVYDPIPKGHARSFFYELKDGTEMVGVSDQLLERDYICKVAELTDGTGLVGDKAAVRTYLGGFVGK
jgi:hypothetical protein